MSLLSNLKLNINIEGLLAVKSAQVLKTRTGDKTYLNLQLTDGCNEISAKQWDYDGETPTAKVLYIKATVGEYRGEFQLIITSFRPAAPEEYDPKQFLPVCPVPLEELWERWNALASQVQNSQLINLLNLVKKKYGEKFGEAPGAVTHHHACLGGCLQHSVSVAEMASLMWQPGLNRDLLIIGGLLHDIGKIIAYDWSEGILAMSDEGQFLDHIIIGGFLLRDLAKEAEVEWKLTVKLLHIVASHHGQLEYGSPVVPKIPEAFIIHHCDMVDANVEKMLKVREKAEGSWAKVYGLGYVHTGE